jgi:hypothetical protein
MIKENESVEAAGVGLFLSNRPRSGIRHLDYGADHRRTGWIPHNTR